MGTAISFSEKGEGGFFGIDMQDFLAQECRKIIHDCVVKKEKKIDI